MRLFRAVSYAELQDILTVGILRPDPPSFQGKWFAERPEEAAEWGRQFYPSGSFHLIEVEADDTVAAKLFRLPSLDQIGPARFAEILDLPRFLFVGEIPIPPVTP
jgi:hypothetical protein